MQSRITIAIVSHNIREDLLNCVTSVVNEHPGRIIVVDNTSTDGTPKVIRKNFPEVHLLTNESNRGYGAALNQAISASRTPFLLFLNGDTIVQPGAIEALARYLDEHPNVGLAGPRLLNRNGTLQRSCRQVPGTLSWLFDNQLLGPLFRLIPFWHGRNLLCNWNHDRSRSVPWMLGAALCVRCEALEQIGGFDERFFLYCEDIDLCCRMHKAGWQVDFVPTAEVVHVGSASTASAAIPLSEHLLASTQQFYSLYYRGLRKRLLMLLLRAMPPVRRAMPSTLSSVARRSTYGT